MLEIPRGVVLTDENPAETLRFDGCHLFQFDHLDSGSCRQHVYSGLYKALSKRCQMVTSPSPGTMRTRFALVDPKIPNATVNTVATYTPYASTAHGLASLAFNNGVGYSAGTESAEGYATDATNGGLLRQAVDNRGGTT